MIVSKMAENTNKNSVKKEEKNELLGGFYANKPAYLVEVSDTHQQVRFVTQRLEYQVATLKLIGYEIKPKEVINNIEDAEKHAKREQIYDITFPWHRILSIRNITYQIKG